MPSTEIPPWADDDPDPAGPVTQAQHAALMRMVSDLKQQVRQLQIEMAQQQADGLAPAPAPGTLTSGKHAGKTREWCVENAPDYVVFLADSGWAESRWGFTPEQVERARENPKLEILRRARR